MTGGVVSPLFVFLFSAYRVLQCGSAFLLPRCPAWFLAELAELRKKGLLPEVNLRRL